MAQDLCSDQGLEDAQATEAVGWTEDRNVLFK